MTGNKLITQSGFTLLELLVALSVFAVMSVMVFGGLREVVNVREATDKHTSRLTELQLAFMYFSRDVRQLANRAVRGEYGDTLNVLQSSDIGKYRIELTRGGYPNPAGLNRSSLQRVAYGIDDNQLYRYRWRVLDRAEDSQPIKTLMLKDVKGFNLRFLGRAAQSGGAQNNKWVSAWPTLTDDEDVDVFPKAIEVSFELEDWGRFTRLFILPDA